MIWWLVQDVLNVISVWKGPRMEAGGPHLQPAVWTSSLQCGPPSPGQLVVTQVTGSPLQSF